MRVFHNLNVDFMGKRKFFYFLSGAILLAGILNIIFRGLQLGIDFKGGSEIVVQFDKPVSISDARDNANKLGIGNPEVKSFGSNGILLRTEIQEIPANAFSSVQKEVENVILSKFPGLPFTVKEKTVNTITYSILSADTVKQAIALLVEAGFQCGKVVDNENMNDFVVRAGISDLIKLKFKDQFKGNSFSIIKEEKVGPKVGDELKYQTLLAVLLSLVGILIYLGFRFKFIFAVGAVVALFHDVLLTLGVYALFYNVIPGLNLEISVAVVASFLTLIGYSVNDTVIVFDRVRENLKLYKTIDIEKNMNDSINKTMSRTVLTGGTTLITIIVLLIFGGEVLRAFAFTLLIGIITGTYSSIFVASAIVLDYAKKSNKKIEF